MTFILKKKNDTKYKLKYKKTVYPISIIILLSFTLLSGCVTISTVGESKSLATAPLPSVIKNMESPTFWNARLANPADVIMTQDEISSFNKDILKLKVYLKDIFSSPATVKGEEVSANIDSLFDWAKSRPFLGHNNYPLTDDFYTKINESIDTEALPDEINVRWGMTVRETDVRVLPTREIAMEAKDDYQFDYFQMSLLSFATPLSVLAQSKDGRWLFVETPYVSGWVRSQDIAIAKNKEEILRYLNINTQERQEKTLLTITGPWVGLYADSRLQTYAGRLRLGTRLPAIKKSGDIFEVLVPSRNFNGTLTFKRGYISRRASVALGIPPYTQENIIKIAFSMLGEPYGWGGMFGFWDCSAYTRDVFSVCGFVLPRNSTSQSKIGVVIGVFDEETPIEDKYKALKDAPPGITLLRLPGHVMIYLGEVDGKHYAIHDTWGFRTKGFLGRSQLHNIGGVVVSELSLGEGGKKGSLIERITHVIMIKAEGDTE